MNARSLLEAIAKAFEVAKLETVMIGNSAAALQGAPVTTDDFDFMFRPTRTNVAKLSVAAHFLGASLSQPEYPVSSIYRIANINDGLKIDMMGAVTGVKSFESLRSRADSADFGDGAMLLIASLEDVIKSKRAAGRKKDKAVLPVLEETLKRKR